MSRILLIFSLLIALISSATIDVTVGYMADADGGKDKMAWDAMAFFTNNITINVGDVIVWNFLGVHTVSFSPVAHNESAVTFSDGPPTFAFSKWYYAFGGNEISDPNGNYSSGFMLPGSNWTTTFSSAGTYLYVCALHPYMIGKVYVVDDNSGTTPEVVAAAELILLDAFTTDIAALETENQLFNTTAEKKTLANNSTQYTVYLAMVYLGRFLMLLIDFILVMFLLLLEIVLCLFGILLSLIILLLMEPLESLTLVMFLVEKIVWHSILYIYFPHLMLALLETSVMMVLVLLVVVSFFQVLLLLTGPSPSQPLEHICTYVLFIGTQFLVV
jgi:plastocyanin